MRKGSARANGIRGAPAVAHPLYTNRKLPPASAHRPASGKRSNGCLIQTVLPTLLLHLRFGLIGLLLLCLELVGGSRVGRRCRNFPCRGAGIGGSGQAVLPGIAG